MTKEELMQEIYIMDPSYKRMGIDLSKHTVEELQKHYDRKKNAPASKNRSRGWYSDYQPRSRAVTTTERSDGFVEVTPSRTTKQDKANSVAISGFDALKKES